MLNSSIVFSGLERYNFSSSRSAYVVMLFASGCEDFSSNRIEIDKISSMFVFSDKVIRLSTLGAPFVKVPVLSK